MTISGPYLVGGLKQHPTEEKLLHALEESLKGGVKIFQLRVKEEISDREHLSLARKCKQLTKKYGALFFMNDRPDLCVLADADGLHIGPKDLEVDDVRKVIGNRLLGLSSHSLNEFRDHLSLDVDYLSIGPVYETDSKVIPDPVVGIETLKEALRISKVPVCAIGGIYKHRIEEVSATGVQCFGVITGIWGADSPQNAAKEYIEIFEKNKI